MPAAGQDPRIASYGAVDYGLGQGLARCAPIKRGAGFAEFLAEIAETWPADQLVLVLEHARDHRSPAMREWGAEPGGRVTSFWLPVYGAHLNLIERVWRLLTQQRACHRFWAEPDKREQAATTRLAQTIARVHATHGPSIVLDQNLCRAASAILHPR